MLPKVWVALGKVPQMACDDVRKRQCAGRSDAFGNLLPPRAAALFTSMAVPETASADLLSCTAARLGWAPVGDRRA